MCLIFLYDSKLRRGEEEPMCKHMARYTHLCAPSGTGTQDDISLKTQRLVPYHCATVTYQPNKHIKHILRISGFNTTYQFWDKHCVTVEHCCLQVGHLDDLESSHSSYPSRKLPHVGGNNKETGIGVGICCICISISRR